MTLRLLQGLALGGEYGGAATYVAEHVPDDQRGYYTSFIQTTATLGFFLSLGVIGACRVVPRRGGVPVLGLAHPVPALVRAARRLALHPAQDARVAAVHAAEGARASVSTNPLKESFGNPRNLRYVLLALFGATAGQGVVWYTGQFYALTFLQKPLKLDWKIAYILMSIALALSTPLFIVLRAAVGPHRPQADHARRAARSPRSPTCRSTWP